MSSAPRLPALKLLGYQQRAYDRAVELFRGTDRVAIVMPTGTGKFFIAAKWALGIGGRVLHVVPHMAIASHQMSSVSSLYSDDLSPIVPVTYAGLVADQRAGRIPTGLSGIILDEFHHVGADVWGGAVDALCAKNPTTPILGLSATPFRPSDGGRDMGAEFFGGTYAERMYLDDAWADPGVPLSPPEYVTCIYEWREELGRMRSSIERISDPADRGRLAKEWERLRRSLEVSDGVAGVMERHIPDPSGHYIFFCAGIRHMDRMDALARIWLRNVNSEIRSYRVYDGGGDPVPTIEKFETDHSSALKLLLCVDMLNEGLHARCDGVIMARPTQSSTVYMQQLGRAMDVGSGRVSVVIDLVDNIKCDGLTNGGYVSRLSDAYDSKARRHKDEGGWGDGVPPFRVYAESAGLETLVGELDRMIAECAEMPTWLAEQWADDLNGGPPTGVTRGSNRRVWWRCKHGHEWESTVATRAASRSGCPYCKRTRVLVGSTDLATTHPDLAREWHPTRNGGLTPRDVMAGSRQTVWWTCERGHEWEAVVCNRARGSGCPYCAGTRTEAGKNDLLTQYPALAAQWAYDLNGTLAPSDVKPGSGKKVWWRCENGHAWDAVIRTRVRDVGLGRKSSCPYCSGRLPIPGETDLATTNPDVAAEWHPENNGSLSPCDVTAGSGRRVWWMCHTCGREWQSPVYTHVQAGAGCRACHSTHEKAQK